MNKHLSADIRVPIEENNLAIRRIESLCIKCGQCRDVCKKAISVGEHFDLRKTNDMAICIQCGQCANICPTGSIVEIQDFMKVKQYINDPKKKVVFLTSPSVRVGIGESFGKKAGDYLEKEMVGSLRQLGADYVFDTTFAADLTIMEEASELIDRVIHHKPLPQFTSCCPAWVKFVETYYSHLLPNISTSKSPISMFGPTIKTYFAKKEGIDSSDIITVALTPCTAKKFEIQRDEMQSAGEVLQIENMRDTDLVITTKELANWMKAENIDLDHIVPSDFDQLMKRGSGAGVIFGNTGGVMEAALRTAYCLLTNTEPPKDYLDMSVLRGLDGIKKAEVTIGDITLKAAVIHGLDNARKFLDDLNKSGEHYDFVEVMTCRGGCIGGGGQPKRLDANMDDVRNSRIQGLYEKDANMKVRYSHDNPDIKQIYKEFFGAPLSELAEKLLHTTYHSSESDLGEDAKKYEVDYQTTLSHIHTNEADSVRYKCSICGYIYEGDIIKESDDYICPVCFVPKEMFEKIEGGEEVMEENTSAAIRYKCTICGYIYEGDITKESDDYQCPICFVPKDMFELM